MSRNLQASTLQNMLQASVRFIDWDFRLNKFIICVKSDRSILKDIEDKLKELKIPKKAYRIIID